jgi:hypothetical protein
VGEGRRTKILGRRAAPSRAGYGTSRGGYSRVSGVSCLQQDPSAPSSLWSALFDGESGWWKEDEGESRSLLLRAVEVSDVIRVNSSVADFASVACVAFAGLVLLRLRFNCVLRKRGSPLPFRGESCGELVELKRLPARRAAPETSLRCRGERRSMSFMWSLARARLAWMPSWYCACRVLCTVRRSR